MPKSTKAQVEAKLLTLHHLNKRLINIQKKNDDVIKAQEAAITLSQTCSNTLRLENHSLRNSIDTLANDVNEKGAEIKRLKEYIETQHAKVAELERFKKETINMPPKHFDDRENLKLLVEEKNKHINRLEHTVKNKDAAIEPLRNDHRYTQSNIASARQKLWLAESRKDRIIKLLAEHTIIHELAECDEKLSSHVTYSNTKTKHACIDMHLNNAIMVVDAVDARVK